LRHPNVVQFLGAAIKPPYFYIISEFCPKGSLDSLLKKEKLTFEIKLRMMLDTALGLLYLSRNNILHRDLKLGNLLVDANYSIKVGKKKKKFFTFLADFGASRMIKMKETRMTKVGTIETCAPEGLFFFLNRNLKSS
jgi:serine/threonine protein kinase